MVYFINLPSIDEYDSQLCLCYHLRLERIQER